MNDLQNNEPENNAYSVVSRIAAIAGIVFLVVCALLLYDYSRRHGKDPLDDTILKTLQAACNQQPQNESLKEQYRELDLHLRREYFRQRAFTHIGGALAMLAAVVFLMAAKAAATARRRLPQPELSTTQTDLESRWTSVARWGVVAVALVLVVGAVALMSTIRSVVKEDPKVVAAMTTTSVQADIPTTTAAPSVTSVASPPSESVPAASAIPAATPPATAPAAAIPPATAPAVDTPTAPAPAATPAAAVASAPAANDQPPPSDEEIRKMWPRFRGPDGSGVSAVAKAPETWDGKAGTNIVWKTAVPLPGNNSPVVWGKQVFLSGADKTRREVFCFDVDSGKLVWQQTVPGTPQSTAKPPKVMDDTGYAASTLATDGRRVYAIFANGDVAAFDMAGKPAWSKSLGIPDNAYGYATSLCTYKNLLLVQFDQGSAKSAKSKLFAFDSATGNTAWQVDRAVPNSWSSPIVIRNGEQDQLITTADPWVIAYNPADGAVLWQAKCLRTDIGPSAVFANGKVYVANDNSDLSAIRADGKGDVTATHIAWKGEDGMPDTASPLATKEYVFLLASFGTLTCYDAEKGEMLWTEEVEGTFSASPALAGNRLYLQSKEGKAYVVEPSREKCKRIGEAELGEECVTSPAFQEGRIYLRGKEHLFCIGTP